MNKKDISAIRRQFKLDNDALHIKEIFTVYVQKETGAIYHQMSEPFEMMERETQELFHNNFKKVLTGQLDTRLFELKFNKEADVPTYNYLLEALQSRDLDVWREQMLHVVGQMTEHIKHDFDTVVTFIYGNYERPVSRDVEATEEHRNDYVHHNDFILCSVNKTTLPKAELTFDYIEKLFRPTTNVDPVIELDKPLAGFLFPVFNEHIANVNHVLYRTAKANEPDPIFVENVLGCRDSVTALEDKDTFEFMVSELAGEQMNAQVISNIYEEIGDLLEESEENEEDPPMLGYSDVENILSMSGVEGVETERVKKAFTSYAADEGHEFKASSLLPKNVKVQTERAKLTLNPQDLKNVKVVNYNGKRCLLLEIDDDIEIEGFHLDDTIELN